MIPERTPQAPPNIPAIQVQGPRPLWSVMIPTYNCYAYLQQTLTSVLVQDPGPDQMQIEVVDDCSTDGDVEQLVRVLGKGRISFYRQPQNSGSLRNFETCINRSQGELVHILHGDDGVLMGFYSEIEKLFKNHPSAGAAFTGLSAIDELGRVMYDNNIVHPEEGILQDWLRKISLAQCLRTCAIVVRRTVYEELGGYFAVHYGEDWEMFVRIAAKFPVAYSPKSLALYRVHNNNISGRSLATGQNIKDIRRVINIIQQYIPEEDKREARLVARKNYAYYFTSNAQGIYKAHQNAPVALKQAIGALRLHFDKKTLFSVLKLYIKVLVGHGTKK